MKKYNLTLLLVSISLISIQKLEAGLFNNRNNSNSPSSSVRYTAPSQQPNSSASQGPTIADCFAQAADPSSLATCQQALSVCMSGGSLSSDFCMGQGLNGQQPSSPSANGPSQISTVQPSSPNSNNSGKLPIWAAIPAPIGPYQLDDGTWTSDNPKRSGGGGVINRPNKSGSSDKPDRPARPGIIGGLLGR